MKRLQDAGMNAIARFVNDPGTARAFRFVSVTLILSSSLADAQFREVMQDLANWRQSVVTTKPVFTLNLQPGALPDTFSTHAMYESIPDKHRTVNAELGWTLAHMHLNNAVPGLPPSMDARIGDLDAVIDTLVKLGPHQVKVVPPAPLILAEHPESGQEAVHEHYVATELAADADDTSARPAGESVPSSPGANGENGENGESDTYDANDDSAQMGVGMLPLPMNNVAAGVKVRAHDGKVRWEKGLKAKVLDANFTTKHYFASERFVSLQKELAPETAFVGIRKAPTWLHYRVARDIAELADVPDETKRALCSLKMGIRSGPGPASFPVAWAAIKVTPERHPSNPDYGNGTVKEEPTPQTQLHERRRSSHTVQEDNGTTVAHSSCHLLLSRGVVPNIPLPASLSAGPEQSGQADILPVSMHDVAAGVKVRAHDGKVRWENGLKSKLVDPKFKPHLYFASERFSALQKELAPDTAFVGPLKRPTWLHYRVAWDIAELAGVPDETKRALCSLATDKSGGNGSAPSNFVNMNELCRRAGTRWHDFNRRRDWRWAVDELCNRMGCMPTDLIHVSKGGMEDDKTCAHPRVATLGGLFLSKQFKVDATGWIEEWKYAQPSEDAPHTWEQALREIRADAGNRMREARVRDALKAKEGGNTEVKTSHGRYVDVLTSTEVIEVKCARHATAALGQVLDYALDWPLRTPRVHLFGTARELAALSMQRLHLLHGAHGVRLTVQEVEDKGDDDFI
jgi:hypothetical protein